MTTARDLMIVALDTPSAPPVAQGELSLALAGAELIDLMDAEAVTLDGQLVVPGLPPADGEGLLREAASSLARQAPYESVEDWLWRRGRGLTAAHLADLESEGLVTRPHTRRLSFRAGPPVPTETSARSRAADRWASREPVLAGLAAAAGIGEQPAEDLVAELADDQVVTVLAAVHDAVMELEAVRQRRGIEDAAFDNVWRAV
ncbi:GPP34 family phosphoprotein [Streptomyces sp. NPDC001812]|uniref:GPP34 family phosphoprotein n=1 Tax=Streptomyces cathayae TaxID=3031124 RepID=A0ABY8JTL8_9ACTN|nr:GPP34 family phosphoprotein [Streptomyces sp. HUAS 5]WGD39315.1 GPP34 family phosphoprotein [Streptomyces sp. HUAS 5]